ncbi:MAG: Grx4 family monothiol glutaredoxin [Methylacidiphilales bacterium]|nr:Grx4 family monothiol glutaredoxin [Candidatus Methylacidiphilales bacterium]
MVLDKNETLNRIKEIVSKNEIVIFMKGTPQFPQCGFSAKASKVLGEVGAQYYAVNVLEDLAIFKFLPDFAAWPTFPQIYARGELIGGCDILVDLYNSGELADIIKNQDAAS